MKRNGTLRGILRRNRATVTLQTYTILFGLIFASLTISLCLTAGPQSTSTPTSSILTLFSGTSRPSSLTYKKPDDAGVITKEDAYRMSSVDYMACCGAGHRISKIADASYLARKLGYSLRSFWGYCDSVEVFDYLFGPQPLSDLVNVTDIGRFTRVNNEVGGFVKLIRKGPNKSCACSSDKDLADSEFYTGLRERFSAKAQVDDFRRRHFANVTSIGIHIRAGNGEVGDFASRGRSIHDKERWLQRIVTLILNQDWGPSILFVATDTPDLISKFRVLLRGKIPVVQFEQQHPPPGSGVFFGERGSVINDGNVCLTGWEGAFADMMLLSYSDVVLSARPSSFTQSLPLSLVLTKPKLQRRTVKAFCEVNPNATEMICYEDYHEWCCYGDTSFHLDGIQKYEYLRVPTFGFVESNLKKIQDRAQGDCIPRPGGVKQKCLPYDWSDFSITTKSVRLKNEH